MTQSHFAQAAQWLSISHRGFSRLSIQGVFPAASPQGFFLRVLMGRNKKKGPLPEEELPLPTWERGWFVQLDRWWQKCEYLPANLQEQDNKPWTFGSETYVYRLAHGSTTEGMQINRGTGRVRKIKWFEPMAENEVPMPRTMGWHVLLEREWKLIEDLPLDLSGCVGFAFWIHGEQYLYSPTEGSKTVGTQLNVRTKNIRKIRLFNLDPDCWAGEASTHRLALEDLDAPSSSSGNAASCGWTGAWEDVMGEDGNPGSRKRNKISQPAAASAASAWLSGSQEVKDWWESTGIGMEYWGAVCKRFETLEDVKACCICDPKPGQPWHYCLPATLATELGIWQLGKVSLLGKAIFDLATVSV